MGLLLVAECHLNIEIASNDGKIPFSSEGDATPNHHTASTKKMLLYQYRYRQSILPAWKKT